MVGWREGLGPWSPVIENGRLYGRGAADDGYAVYAALTIVQAIDAQKLPRPRCVGLIETCEESGSPDLPAYLKLLAPRMGQVKLVAGLDSGCGNYDQLWVTSSLRGLVGGVLTVEVLTEGVHSGMASGLVPSSFRIARQLLNRIDNAATGEVLLPELHAEIPAERLAQAQAAGAILGDAVWKHFPWVGCSHEPGADPAAHDKHAHAMPTTTDPVQAILARTWRPALSVTGAAGLPSLDAAGNVLRPKTSLKLSMRLPPTVDGERATRAMKPKRCLPAARSNTSPNRSTWTRWWRWSKRHCPKSRQRLRRLRTPPWPPWYWRRWWSLRWRQRRQSQSGFARLLTSAETEQSLGRA